MRDSGLHLSSKSDCYKHAGIPALDHISRLPMQRITESLVRDLADDVILGYYLEEAWEGPLRKIIRDVASAYALGAANAETVRDALRLLNHGYRTRCSLSALYTFGEVAASVVEEKGWWKATPPTLFGSTESDAHILTSVPLQIISGMAARKLPRPYSLSTKYLHFLFPESFAICDQRAAASVQIFAYYAFGQRGKKWRTSAWSHVGNMGHGGYACIVDFYRLFWAAATADEREAVTAGAARISDRIGAPVSAVDVLDKLLWRANGDPLELGFHLA